MNNTDNNLCPQGAALLWGKQTNEKIHFVQWRKVLKKLKEGNGMECECVCVCPRVRAHVHRHTPCAVRAVAVLTGVVRDPLTETVTYE